ncbi:MAG TPA: hypothetical protein VNI20_04020 [Fimbriimonadaceae bacterium]|nr:hypothetical protein [Fimbriimonadaceae bacterium]
MLATLTLLVSVVPAPVQTSANLKLKLREDETVHYRSITDIVTYSPDGIEERVANALYAFTFGETKDGKTPVAAKIESIEGMDEGTNNGSQAISTLDLSFVLDKSGETTPTQFKAEYPALQPVGKLITTVMDGQNSLGFLGFAFPEDAHVKVGDTWSKKVDAAKFLAPVYGVAGDMIKVDGVLDATFKLEDIVNVNKKSHARVSVTVTGKCNVDVNSPDLQLSGVLDVKSDTGLVIDLSTGLITRSKTDTTGNLDVQVAQAQIEVMQLVYRKP